MPTFSIRPRLQALTSLSLRAKIAGITVGVGLFLGVNGILLLRTEISRALSSDLRSRGEALARDLATRSTSLVLTDNRFSLHELLGNTLQGNLDVRYVIVVGADGGVLAHSFEGPAPRDLLDDVDADREPPYPERPLLSEEGRLLELAAPILGGRLGRIRVGMSFARLDASLARSLTVFGVGLGAALLVGLAVALVLTRVLTRPLAELVSLAREIAAGDLSGRASVRAADEMGELVRTFNTMVGHLGEVRSELLRRVRDLEALSAVDGAFSGNSHLADSLHTALQRTLDVIGLSIGWVLFDEGDGGLNLLAAIGLPNEADTNPGAGLAVGCPCEQVVLDFHARMTTCVRDHGSCCGLPAALTARADVAYRACVPLVAADRVVGVMIVAGSSPRSFAPDELALLSAIGRAVGLAAEHARLADALKTRETRLAQLLSQIISAQEAERRRIARELHDETGQLLTALAVGLRTIERTDRLSDTSRRALSDSLDLVKRLLEEVHRIAVGLRPSLLDHLGLVGAIESCAREFGARAHLRVDFEVSGLDGTRLSEEVETTVYRVVQEALANVGRHANASRVGVMLRRLNGSVMAVVEDDGVGFDSAVAMRSPGTGHLGLFGMQERAALLNGRLTIESQRGYGATVIVEVPLGHVYNPASAR